MPDRLTRGTERLLGIVERVAPEVAKRVQDLVQAGRDYKEALAEALADQETGRS